jgi:hypothetical protein
VKTVSVGELSHKGVSRVVSAAEQEPVLISKNNEPAVWMLSARQLARLAGGHEGGQAVYANALRLLAVTMFDEGILSLGQAAHLAGLPLGEFIELCGRLGVATLREPGEGVEAELARFDEWFGGERAQAPGTEPATR